MTHDSVYVRIGELLKAFEGEEVSKDLIQTVAYTHDDFEKRMRELRKLGWRYRPKKRKEGRRFKTYFILDRWYPWPDNPAAEIRAVEDRAGVRRKRRSNR